MSPVCRFSIPDRESIASQCMDIHRNPKISKWISIKAWIIEDLSIKNWYPFMGIYCLRISIAECPCMDIRAWISMWISTLVWIIEDWHPKIIDIHVDIRGFLEIHAWIGYGFSEQGSLRPAWLRPQEQTEAKKSIRISVKKRVESSGEEAYKRSWAVVCLRQDPCGGN